MALNTAPPLPADLFHLLSAELAERWVLIGRPQTETLTDIPTRRSYRRDFATLYSCVASSKYLGSAGSVSALYRFRFWKGIMDFSSLTR